MVNMDPGNQLGGSWSKASHGSANFGKVGKSSGKKKWSMSNDPKFADAYSVGKTGRRYIDIKKAFALGRVFYDAGDKRAGDLLFARGHGAFEKMKKWKMSQGGWGIRD